MKTAILILSIFAFSIGCHAGKTEPKSAVTAETAASAEAKDIKILSRSLQYDGGSNAVSSMQLAIELNGERQILDFKHDSQDPLVRLVFVLSEVGAETQKAEQQRLVNQALQAIVETVVLRTRDTGRDVQREALVVEKLRAAGVVAKSVASVKTTNELRSLSQMLAKSAEDYKRSVVEKGDSDPAMSNRAAAAARFELNLDFWMDGQDLFAVIANHMTFEQQTGILAPITKELNEAVTLTRARRSADEIRSTARRLLKAIEATETTISDLVSTREFSTTGPKVREWIHSLAAALETTSRFELKAVNTEKTPSSVVPGRSLKALLSGPISIRDVPEIGRSYVDFIEAGTSNAKQDAAMKAARTAVDDLQAQIIRIPVDAQLMSPSIQNSLAIVLKRLRVFDRDLDRLKKTMETQALAMQYGIWLKRLEASGAEL